MSTSHNMLTGGNQQLVADISGGVSLVLFLSIIAYHVFKQAVRTDMYREIYMTLRTRFRPLINRDDNQEQLLPPTENELAPMTTIISLPSK